MKGSHAHHRERGPNLSCRQAVIRGTGQAGDPIGEEGGGDPDLRRGPGPPRRLRPLLSPHLLGEQSNRERCAISDAARDWSGAAAAACGRWLRR